MHAGTVAMYARLHVCTLACVFVCAEKWFAAIHWISTTQIVFARRGDDSALWMAVSSGLGGGAGGGRETVVRHFDPILSACR